MSSAFSSVNKVTVSANGISYHPENLQLDKKQRHVFKTGTYPDSKHYSVVMLAKGDGLAMYTAAEMIRAINYESLKFRTEEEYERMLSYGRFNGSGGFMVGIVDENDRLIGMSGIEAMDDESDHGSGPVVLHNGVKNNYDQVHYKALGLLPEARGKGHMEELYRVRDELFVMTGRPFAVMKTNTPFVIDRAVENGWINQTKNPQPGWNLNYETEAAKFGKSVDVLTLTREVAMAHIANNKSDIVMPDNLCIIKPDDGYSPTIH